MKLTCSKVVFYIRFFHVDDLRIISQYLNQKDKETNNEPIRRRGVSASEKAIFTAIFMKL